MTCFERVTDRVVVAGPPCSGKTTSARSHAAAGDEVLDWDVVCAEITGAPLYVRPRGSWSEVEAEFRRRAAALERGWIIRSAPRQEERARLRELYRARSVVLLVPAALCLARLALTDRPDHVKAKLQRAVTDWWAAYSASSSSDEATVTFGADPTHEADAARRQVAGAPPRWREGQRATPAWPRRSWREC